MGETWFFRDQAQWSFLERRVLPPAGARGHAFQAWSAGCSTGEEPYTLAVSSWNAAWPPAPASRVKVAEDGEALSPGTVYLAPDRCHLGVRGDAVALSDEPPIEGFKPSGTYLFESLARSFGPAALGLILSGMGRDGVRGLAALRSAGGTVVAQDRNSSVIFGMNGEAVLAGLTDEVLPLDALAYLLMQAV